MWERKGHSRKNVPPLPEPQRENRYVYSGDRQNNTTVSGYAVRQNKHGARKRLSTFNFIIGLFALGILVVLYINNTIAVDELTGENNALRLKKLRQLDLNAAIQAEVNRKSSLERVGRIAVDRLGMVYQREAPQTFEIPSDLKERAMEAREEFPQ